MSRYLKTLLWFFGVAHLAFGVAGLVFPRWFYATVPPWPPLHVGQIQIAGVFDLALAVLFLAAATDVDRYLPVVIPVGVVGECGHALVRIGHIMTGDNPTDDLLAPTFMLLFALVLLGIGLATWRQSRADRPARPMATLHSHWLPVTLCYLASFALLVVGPPMHSLCLLGAAIALFTLWDLLWVTTKPCDRTAQEVLDSSTRARTYMSYFVAVYGAGLAYFLLRIAENEQKEVLRIVADAGVPLPLLLAPFILPTIAMLFFPITLGADNGSNLAAKQPTPANLAVLAFTAWTEKVATFTFVYLIAMIGISLSD